MAEATLEENGTGDLISGLNTGDLSAGVYEGGFKTWECAVDLAGFVANHVTFTKDEHWEVVELGAGSAIPSLALLREAFSRTRLGNETVKFTYCDYNEEVLQLVTMPNILLSWWDVCRNSGRTGIQKDRPREGDLEDVNEDMVQMFLNDCKSRGISFNFISGAWGSSFVHLIEGSLRSETDVPTTCQHNLVIMASETIYCPSSVPAFVRTVMDLLRATRGRATAFIAAKRLYFGVGGGVTEFVQEMRSVGGSVREVINITDNGVGRVILEVSLAQAIK
jgi:protein-histidine N-methyltransferase